MRIVVSGGGSAGHISPVLATCDALKSLDKDLELLYVGQGGGMEERIVAARHLQFAPIKAGKFRRDHFAGTMAKLLNPKTLGPNSRDAIMTVAGVAGSVQILRRFKPDVVFAKSGFVALPVGIAARILRIPLVIHESDVTMGLANRIMSRWAERIAVGFPVKSYTDLDKARLVYTGNPVRVEIGNGDKAAALAKFGLSSELPVVFVTGGSQGAREMNDAFLAAAAALVQFCQVILLTGENGYENAKFEFGRLGKFEHSGRFQIHSFFMGEMALAYAAADVVVARAGANNIAELEVLGKPTVLIPNTSMAGHQVANARVMSRAGAVRVLDSTRLTPERLVGELKRVLDDREEQARLSKAIKALAMPEAAQEMAKLVLSVGGAGQDARRGEESEQ